MAEEFETNEDEIIEVGKEKGYLTFGEVNDLLPGDITSPDDLDDLLTTINTQGIELGGETTTAADGATSTSPKPAKSPRT